MAQKRALKALFSLRSLEKRKTIFIIEVKREIISKDFKNMLE